jgi:hypothetical protein
MKTILAALAAPAAYLPIDARLFEAAEQGDELARDALAVIDCLQCAIRDVDVLVDALRFAILWRRRGVIADAEVVDEIAQLLDQELA